MLERFYNSYVLYLLVAVSLALIGYVDPTSYLSYAYSALLIAVFCRFLAKGHFRELFFFYNSYAIVAIIFTIIFKEQSPLYLGMTGPEGTLGTDDCRYYAQIVGGLGVNYTIQVGTWKLMPFSILLKTLYPFTVHTPLNIVLLNVVFTSLLPYYCALLANELFHDRRVSQYTELLVFLCPFTVYFGCIIMRDIFCAMLVVAGLYYFLRRQYIHFSVCFLFLAWVRLGTAAFLISGIIVLFRDYFYKKTGSHAPFVIFLAIFCIGFYVFYDYIQVLSNGKLSDSFIREADSDFFQGTTIAKITSLPFPINVIGGAVFFLFIPLFYIPVPQYGYLLVSSIFQGFLTPFFMFFLWNNIFKGTLTCIRTKRNELTTLLLLILVFAALLGTISLQTRHKTVLFPFLCMLAAYGKYYSVESSRRISTLLSTSLITGQIILALFSL